MLRPHLSHDNIISCFMREENSHYTRGAPSQYGVILDNIENG